MVAAGPTGTTRSRSRSRDRRPPPTIRDREYPPLVDYRGPPSARYPAGPVEYDRSPPRRGNWDASQAGSMGSHMDHPPRGRDTAYTRGPPPEYRDGPPAGYPSRR